MNAHPSIQALALAAACLSAHPADAAQQPTPAPPAEFFAGRRAALVELIRPGIQPGERHWVVVRGATSAADMAQFYQDHNFYYLTGVREPDAALVINVETGDEELLVPPFSRFTAQWEGQRLAPGEAAAKKTGFAAVGNSRGLHRRLEAALGGDGGGKAVLWTFTTPQPNRTATSASAARAASASRGDRFDGRGARAEAWAAALRKQYPDAEIRDVMPMMGTLRGVKQPEEVALVRAASALAARGIAAAMRAAAPGAYEFQLAAAARYEFSRHGAGPDAYAAIVGAAGNGCVLHYSANTKQLEDGDLIVMDYGPTVHGYCSDVTRTFPASGVYTDAQRKLVEDVHAVQQALFAKIRPGARLSELSQLCAQLLAERGYRSFHGPCHHVGLAVHDLGSDELREGMIITVEPGAYLPDERMGCRIEDTILITADGYENLSADVPSTPDAIEALMRSVEIRETSAGQTGR